MNRNKILTYSELISLPTYEARFNYVKLSGSVGVSTFGYDRYLNQDFYRSREWKQLRDRIFVRDLGGDLACEDRQIIGIYIIHHMNPLEVNDIIDSTDFLLNPEYLITTSPETHNAIHYGDLPKEPSPFAERKPYDTSPWRKFN